MGNTRAPGFRKPRFCHLLLTGKKTLGVKIHLRLVCNQAVRISKLWRKRFDRMVERVLEELPASIRKLLDAVPLRVEDYPPRKLMKQTGVEEPDELCGLFTGVPVTEQNASSPVELPPFVTIYRAGILAATRERHGQITPLALREQIRITLLHELAHYHGLDEEELEQLGYD